MKISPDRGCNGGGCKNKLNNLCHTPEKAHAFAQGTVGIVKSSPGFGNGTSQFGIAEGKGDVHQCNKKRRYGQAQRTTFGQPQVPAKIHT